MPKTLAQDALDRVSPNKEQLASERGAARGINIHFSYTLRATACFGIRLPWRKTRKSWY
jgi:hypothetical protein